MTATLSLLEMRELITLIQAKYSYDLSGYTEASLQRRFTRIQQMNGLSFFDFKYKLTNQPAFLDDLLNAIPVNVTEMFRDPEFFKLMRAHVLPELAKLPVINIWHSGCATGEEAYSMAILLQEADLLSRTKIYATDISKVSLDIAEAGIIPLNKMKQYTTNYLQAGGLADFSTYYTAHYDGAIINRELRHQIHFSQHNLISDQMFNNFDLICCRNVLIYFKKSLQSRAIGLFEQSLTKNGFLALGSRESLIASGFQHKFETAIPKQRIFRRKRLTN